MLTIQEFRQLNGEAVQHLTDEEVVAVLDEQYAFAQLIFEQWQKDMAKSQPNLGEVEANP